MNGLLDHVMIRVDDLQESLDWYQTHLEYEEKDRYEGEDFEIYLKSATLDGERIQP